MSAIRRNALTEAAPALSAQAAETRQRIIDAGAELLYGFPTWNWSALTVPAVSERAGVTERTVYRHFGSQRGLRDAVLLRLERDANVTMEDLQLHDIAEIASRILQHSSKFPLVPRTQRDPTVAAANAKQRQALLSALAPHTAGWSATDRAIAGGVLDVLWSVVSYERLVGDWDLDPTDAIRGTAWAIRLLEEAIRADRRPAGSD